MLNASTLRKNQEERSLCKEVELVRKGEILFMYLLQAYRNSSHFITWRSKARNKI